MPYPRKSVDWRHLRSVPVPERMADGGMVDCPKCGHSFAHGGEVTEEEFADPLEEAEEGRESESFMSALRKRRSPDP